MTRAEKKEMSIVELWAHMVTSGWKPVMTIGWAPSRATNYGFLFVKDGQKFYLNNETRESIPA
jgi:hypothetical protein